MNHHESSWSPNPVELALSYFRCVLSYFGLTTPRSGPEGTRNAERHGVSAALHPTRGGRHQKFFTKSFRAKFEQIKASSERWNEGWFDRCPCDPVVLVTSKGRDMECIMNTAGEIHMDLQNQVLSSMGLFSGSMFVCGG